MNLIPSDNCFNSGSVSISVSISFFFISRASKYASIISCFSSSVALWKSSSISIPTSVKSLEQFAFQSCRKLASITIPNSVTTIGRYCFSGYSGLKEVIVNATVPPTLGVDAFTSNLKYIKVPRASLNAYKKANNWSDYAGKIVAQ